MENNNRDNSKKISLLQRKISHLRFFVYVSVAAVVLITCVIFLWIYTTYTEVSPFEIYYSVAPKSPKALLYLSPKEGHYKVGEEFSVDVLVNTMGSNVVGVAAYLSYNKKNLKALSVDLSESIFEIPFENKIDPKEGKIKIAVAKPTPGVKVYNGKVATIWFKALAAVSPYRENISFDFTKGSSLYSAVIIDDKKGTTILDATRGAKINIE